MPVWQRKEVQEVLRQIDAFGTVSRGRDQVLPLMHGAKHIIRAELGRLGLHEEAVAWARRADELAPGNHLHLNDLGWALYQAGYLEEAEATLEKAVSLAPPEYELARNNLEEVRVALHGKRALSSPYLENIRS